MLKHTHPVIATDPDTHQVFLETTVSERGSSTWHVDGHPVSVQVHRLMAFAEVHLPVFILPYLQSQLKPGGQPSRVTRSGLPGALMDMGVRTSNACLSISRGPCFISFMPWNSSNESGPTSGFVG